LIPCPTLTIPGGKNHGTDCTQDRITGFRIPRAVYDEVVNAGKGRAGNIEVASADWIHCHQVSNSDIVVFLRTSLDAGEAEAIVLTREIGADLVLLDDRDSRNTAESVGMELPLRGRSVSCCVTITVILRILKMPRRFNNAVVQPAISLGGSEKLWLQPYGG